MTQNNVLTLSALSLALLASFAAQAQIAPDAGSVLQQQTKPGLEAPRPAPALQIEAPTAAPTLPGGVQLSVQSVQLSGNTVYSEAQLRAVLGDVVGKSYDLAGLRALAAELTDFYRANGYPFARAYLPTQSLADGALHIDVIEGRYGQVSAQGDDRLARAGQGFLSALKPGAVIDSAALERATLILSDQPGVQAAPVIRPGQQPGSADLDVVLARGPRVGGDVGLDTDGNRYTGLTRAKANVHVDSPFLLGDQILANALVTEDGMWLGSLSYALPLGASGLRGNVGYSHTYYALGKEFASLSATGTADVSSLGLSYPVLRSQQANLNLSANWQHKDLNDKQGSTLSNGSKSSDAVPVTLGFDARDGLAGGGVSYGSLAWTGGTLHLDSALSAADSSSAKTQGQFNKFNLDAARLQTLPAGLTGYGHLAAQFADKNLDSSERFALGGPGGVRAYPVGEGSGDEGWLAQIELRYAMGAISPYAFYDAGTIRVNAKSWTSGSNERSLSGGGLGLRYQAGNVSVDLALAWRNEGGKPQSDTLDNSPQAWLSASYRF